MAATPFQRAMAWLVVPLAVLLPVWFAMGRMVITRDGGWATIMLMGLAVIGAGVLALHAILTCSYASKVYSFAAGRKASWAALAAYLLVVVIPLWVEDYGDVGPSSPAPMSDWFGLPDQLAGAVLMVLLGLLCFALVAMIVLDIVELTEIGASSRLGYRATRRPY